MSNVESTSLRWGGLTPTPCVAYSFKKRKNHNGNVTILLHTPT
nr:MAG TPA: hypothetical protein [Caudoviricetes sp.]